MRNEEGYRRGGWMYEIQEVLPIGQGKKSDYEVEQD